MSRLLSALSLLLLGTAPAVAADQVAAFVAQARAAAISGWHPDARLVEVEVSGYGFVPDLTGPVLRSDQTPKVALLYFYSPSAPDELLRVMFRFNFPPEQQAILRQRPELGRPRWEKLPGGRSLAPYTLPVPDGITDVTDAAALAERSGLQADCAGTNPAYGCAIITRAELHTYLLWNGRSVPVWRVGFGQDAQAKEIVRLVDAATGRVITNCAVPDGSTAAGSPGTVLLACR
jgi:hypothetical protein